MQTREVIDRLAAGEVVQIGSDIRVCPVVRPCIRDTFKYREESALARLALEIRGAENTAVLADARLKAIEAYRRQTV
jgi:hypothetical protein